MKKKRQVTGKLTSMLQQKYSYCTIKGQTVNPNKKVVNPNKKVVNPNKNKKIFF
jgi:hypothetical protein